MVSECPELLHRDVSSYSGAPERSVYVEGCPNHVARAWFCAAAQVSVRHQFTLRGLASDAPGSVPLMGVFQGRRPKTHIGDRWVQALAQVPAGAQVVLLDSLHIFHLFLNNDCLGEVYVESLTVDSPGCLVGLRLVSEAKSMGGGVNGPIILAGPLHASRYVPMRLLVHLCELGLLLHRSLPREQ